jgi:hypothetical protein
MKHLTLVLLLALLAIPATAQTRLLTAAEADAGWFDITIPINTSVTDSIAIVTRRGGNCIPVGIQMPAAWTPANLTFLAAASSSTPAALHDQFGTEVTATAAASRYIALDPAQFFGIRVLQIRSGIAASAVNQAAARTLRVVCR